MQHHGAPSQRPDAEKTALCHQREGFLMLTAYSACLGCGSCPNEQTELALCPAACPQADLGSLHLPGAL
jgi:hypothetical protein